VLPNGVDYDSLQESRNHPKPEWYRPGWCHVGVIGYPAALKNQELLLRAVALLRNSHPKVAGIVIGSPGIEENVAYLGRLRKMTAELGLEDHILLLPFERNKKRLFAGLDIVASTSLREGFGRTLIEGMAAHRPVVALKAGGPECVIEDGVTGLLVDKNDPEAFARALATLIEDEALRQDLVRNAARVAQERFSASAVANGYAALMSTLLARN
jgi:glycosyltransferase involved in cell wall biosynthesis